MTTINEAVFELARELQSAGQYLFGARARPLAGLPLACEVFQLLPDGSDWQLLSIGVGSWRCSWGCPRKVPPSRCASV